jgi:hypothetical protein
VLAQELRETIPSAVCETGDLNLNNGEKIENFLNVDKSRVYMECVGAVIELGKKAENFDGRIEKLEQHIAQDDIIVSLDATSKKNDTDLNDSLDLNKECEQKSDSSNQKIKKKPNKYGMVSLSFLNRFRECENTEHCDSINPEDKKVKKAPCAPRWFKVILGLILFTIVTGY